MKRILWLSRHNPLHSQEEELQKLFGDVFLKQDPNPFESAEEIVRRYRADGYDDMVVVAPLSVIARLCELQINPLWAEMKTTSKSDAELFLGNRCYKFIKFRRIKGINVEFMEI